MAALRWSTVRNWSSGLRILIIFFLLLSAFGPLQATPVLADKLVCGVPGKDGPASVSGIVNTYYPGTANVASGSTSIPVGNPSGAATPIAAGDLLLVIQMQGADINSTNTGAYGDGAAGDPATGNLAANFTAGLYEYVVATSGVTGGTVSISSGLVHDYFQQDYPVGAGNQGQRRFQVIRIPQYSSANLVGTVTAPAWNGSIGGVVGLDVAGTLNLGGNTIDVSGLGFRGGGGVKYAGGTGVLTDYVTLSTNAANSSKAEGTAGTPRFLYTGSAVLDLGVGQEGYPDGSFARGAPGNAGGGATDGNPTTNEENTGGGGGGNGGAGGQGGTAWNNAPANSGGFGGDAFSASAARLVMGGGGGSGTINNNDPVLSSGAAGGGIVMVRAGTVNGTGAISANGNAAPGQPLNDSGGGGGAGGSVLVLAKNGALPAGLDISANGGRGGDAWLGQAPGGTYPGERHGPGGGGGGGVIYVSSTPGALSVNGGQNGLTTTANDNYLSTPGAPGVTGTVTANSVTTGISGAECIPTPSVVKTTSTPIVSQTVNGTTGEYTIVVSIPANQGTALGFTISDTLPTGFTYASTTSVNTSGGATRGPNQDPTAGTSTPAWGTFDIPGGGQVQITFAVDIAASVPAGIYQNPATATYTDPTRTTANGTTNSQYDPASSTGEDIEVIISSLPDLTVAKTNNVSGTVPLGSSFNWTIAVTNSGAGPATFAAGQTIMSDPLPGAAGYYPQGAVTVNNSPTTPPTGTITCAINTTTLTCTATTIVTLPTGSSFGVTFPVTPTTAGDLANTATVDPNGIMAESNETNNTASDTVSVLGADLSIVKTDGQTSYLAGSVVIYTVTVSNVSGVAVNGATVSDAKPANISTWAWACTTQGGGATGCDPAADGSANFTDTVNLPVGGSIVYTVTANVLANATGDLVNTATVALPTGYTDPTPGNNSSTDTDTLTSTSVDLAISKTDGQTGYTAGGTVVYTVTVSNLSGVDVTNAAVSDPLPANITSWTWTCVNQAGATGCTGVTNSTTNFTDTVNLPVGGSIVYTVTANVIASAVGDLVNTATITPPNGFADTNPSNNTATDTDVLAVADLSITKNDGQTTYTGGSVLTYTVTVTNLSGVTVNGATVTDPKPANISTWAWACTTQGGGATGCDSMANSAADFTDTVNLPVGGTIVYTVTANTVASPTGNLVNTATVGLPTGIADSNPTNNTATDTDIFGQAADLSLTKAVDRTSASAGSNVTFTLTVTNIGPDPASSVEVTDKLPSGFTYVSSTPSKGTYDSTTGVWVIGDMAVNETVTITMTATVNSSGSYTNQAEITKSSLIDPDSTPANGVANEDDLGSVTITIPGARPTPKPKPSNNPQSLLLIPNTGFEPGVATDLSSVPHESYLAMSDVTLEIPSLKVNISIVGVPKRDGTWNVSWLEDQAGWLEGSAFPSWSGNSVLTGHVVLADGLPGPFINLNKLKYGDKIVVHAYGQKYTFAVQTNTVVDPKDRSSMLKHEETPWLTLVTCKDFDSKTNTYLSRLLVRAALVSVAWEK